MNSSKVVPLVASFVLLGSFLTALEAQTVVIAEGDVIRYVSGFYPPPADWNQPGFDPDEWSWEKGFNSIGYGDGDDLTELFDMFGNYLSIYVHIEFEVPKALAGAEWTMRVRYDDGFVAYIDGEEVARRGLEGNPPGFFEAAANHEITSPVGFDEAITLDVEPLAPGRHVFSAQVHNADLLSTDLSFAVELSGRVLGLSFVSPATGPVEGGNPVSIFGVGLDRGEPEVLFGGVSATEVEIVSSEELRVVVPPGTSPGTVSVSVANNAGTATLELGYRYRGEEKTGLFFLGAQAATSGIVGTFADEGTFELWCRRGDDPANDLSTVLAVEDTAGEDIFRIDIQGGRIRARSWIGEDSFPLGTREVPFDVNAWHHVAFSYSPGRRRVYVDGIIVARDTLTMDLTGSQRIRLGAPFGDGTPFRGAIESVRAYAVERSPVEIRRHRGREAPPDAEPEVAWNLEEGVGPFAADQGRLGIRLDLGTAAGPDLADPEWVPLGDYPPLLVTGLAPDRGALRGGEEVRVFGAGFSADDIPEVQFGFAESSSVVVESPWELRVTVPAGESLGDVDLRIQNRRGAVLSEKAYLYAPAEVGRLVEEGDLWDYFFGDPGPPANWIALDFNAEAEGWARGPTGIGFGDSDDATELFGMQDAFATLYARTVFELDGDPEALEFLRFLIRFDDGYVAYLNGNEIARANVSGRPPGHNELASDLHEIRADGPGLFDEVIDLLPVRAFLRPGPNVLAVEVHNFTLDSSDLSLSAALEFAFAAPPSRPFRRGDANTDRVVNVSDIVTIALQIAGARPMPCPNASDINADGRLELADASVLMLYLFRSGPSPAAPFVACGAETGPSELRCEIHLACDD